VLREIFGLKRDEVTRTGKLLNEEVNDLCCPRNIVRVIKWGMIWTLHVACTGKAEVHTGILGETWGKEATLKTDIDGRIILKLISKKSVGRAWMGFMWFRIGTSGGLLRGSSWLAEELLASEESLCSTQYWLHIPQWAIVQTAGVRYLLSPRYATLSHCTTISRIAFCFWLLRNKILTFVVRPSDLMWFWPCIVVNMWK